MLHNKNHKKLHNLEITPHDQPEEKHKPLLPFAGFLLGVPIYVYKMIFFKLGSFEKTLKILDGKY